MCPSMFLHEELPVKGHLLQHLSYHKRVNCLTSLAKAFKVSSLRGPVKTFNKTNKRIDYVLYTIIHLTWGFENM